MRLIDADALKAIRFHYLPYSQIVPADCDTDEKVYAYKLGWNDAIDAIVEAAPTVDAVEVVRCKDCKHGQWHIDLKGLRYLVCSYPFGHGLIVGNHNFCSWGERRGDEDE